MNGIEYGATTGRPRRTGWFDVLIGRYAVMVNGLDAIALTKRFLIIHEGEVAFDGDLVQLRQSTDDRVIQFLAPSRSTIQGVIDRKFIEANG